MSAPAEASKERNYAIDVIKLMSCLVVLCSHSRNLTEAVPAFVDTRWIAIGTPIVQLFFCISGYFMIDSFCRSQRELKAGAYALQYTLKKLGRIFPYYIFSLVLCFIFYSQSHVKSLSDFVKVSILAVPEILGISAFGLDYQFLNSVTWYISAMLAAIFFCAYILHKNADFYINFFAPLLFFLLIGFEAQTKGTLTEWNVSAGVIMNSLIRACEGVCSGAAAYLIKNYVVKHKGRNYFYSIVECVGYVLIYGYCFLMKTDRNISLYIVLLFPIMIGITASNVTISAKLFRGRIFKLCGMASLLLYLNHLFIKSYVIWRYFKNFEFWEAFLVYIGGTILLSAAAYFVIRFLKQIKSKFCV